VWVKELKLTDFRSYRDVTCHFDTGVSTFIGRNGRGKTNLIEAIAYCSTLGSHRVATDAPLVRVGAEQAVIHLAVVSDVRETTIDLLLQPGKANKARINGSPLPKARDVLGVLRTVLFAPEDLAIVKADPSDRRRFMDDLLVQRRPAMLGVRQDYDRVLKQRNALLKSARAARGAGIDALVATLEPWDEQLVTLGSQIIAARQALLQELQPYFTDTYAALADNTHATIDYVSSLDPQGQPGNVSEWREAMNAGIQQRRRAEFERGITLIGPQRDDMSITLAELPAKGYASHGESWSLALALRLACLAVLTNDDEAPVLILDDVFAELDAQRRDHLIEAIAGVSQVIITAAVAEDVPVSLRGAQYWVTEDGVERR
jgi:DNA replication and repair protein RecF